MRTRGIVILNPNAGGGATAAEVRQLISQRPDWEVRETTRPGDASALARQAAFEGEKLIVVAGGDGALSEVVSGLAGKFDEVELGILPAGTSNDFARTLEIPSDLGSALRTIELGRTRRADVVRCRNASGEGYLTNAATGGFSVTIDEEIDESSKRRWGRLSYVIAGLRCMRSIPSYRLSVRADEDAEWSVETCGLVVANGEYAGGMRLAPEADEADHELDLVVITAQTLAERVELAARFALEAHLDSPGVVYRRAHRFMLDSDPPMPFHADGESIGETPLELEIVPGALRLVVPADETGGV